MEESAQPVDLLVIGGGINGVGIARDAAGRGLSVVLCEQGDLAGGTSSASSKLIHGGLRYLEQFKFHLVREALAEREVLLACAPHIIRPLRIVLPHDRQQRPAWMIRAGLFLYDHLSARNRLPGSSGVDLEKDAAGASLQPRFSKGFVFSDCWADDSRLVVLNAMDAAARGATILTRAFCESARRKPDFWEVTVRDTITGGTSLAKARVLVNAAGPWVKMVNERAFGMAHYGHLLLSKGSHIVVPRLYEGEHAYLLQNVDRRVVFVLPFQERYSMIGTTDVFFEGDPGTVAVDPEEIRYLCEAVNRFFAGRVSPSDVVWSFAGLRPLFGDEPEHGASHPADISREYALELDGGPGQPPLLTVIGGKITAYRQVAEKALGKLKPFLPGLGAPWTKRAHLPGGDLPSGDFPAFLADFQRARSWLPAPLARRLAGAYGTLAEVVLGNAASLEELGFHFGGGLYEREAEYLVSREWAQKSEDILWRRSKLGLQFSPEQTAGLEAWLARNSTVRARHSSGK